MEEYNLGQLSEDVSGNADNLKNDFIELINNDFLQNIIGFDGSITSNHFGSLRDAIDITINSITSVETLLQDAISNIKNFTIDPIPESITAPINRDVEALFTSTYITDLETHLSEIYSSELGNTGYSYDGMAINKIDAISQALMTKEYELDADILEVDIDTIANNWAADGYESAPGALSFDIAQAINSFDNARETKVGSPATMLSRAIETNIKSAYENGISIEKLQMAFAKKHTQLKYDHINAEIKAYIAEIEKVQKEMSAPVMAIAAIIRAAKVDYELDEAEAKLLLDVELNKLKNWVSGITAKNQTVIGLDQTNAQILGDRLDAYVGLFSTFGSLFGGVNIQEQTVEE